MRHVVQRIGFRISRGWAVFIVLVGVLVAAAFWLGPLKPLPPDLQLAALGEDGQFHASIEMPRSWADTTPPQPDVPARFPLVLGVFNQGARAAQPVQLSLSVPAKFRLSNTAGQAYEGRGVVGNPLVHYVFDIDPGTVAPRQVPRVLTTLDTLWLEPVVPTYYCTALTDSVPEFLPAPAQDPNTLSRIRIFYSFDASLRARQTGVLTVSMDPDLIKRTPPPPPARFPAKMIEPEYPKPEMGELRRIGSRTTRCGDPASGLVIQDVLWETPEGGRFFVVYNGATPRKYMFDLNRDSVIELEMWDSNGDGLFEAGRPARLVIPEFLMPARPVLAALDTVLTDSAGGPVAAPAGGSLDSATLHAPVPRLDYRFPPQLFGNTNEGPFRFWRALQQQRTPAVPPASPPADSQRPPVRRDTVDEPAQRREPERPPPTRPPATREDRPRAPAAEPTPPRSDSGPRLLGRELPNAPPPPRRDTLSAPRPEAR